MQYFLLYSGIETSRRTCAHSNQANPAAAPLIHSILLKQRMCAMCSEATACNQRQHGCMRASTSAQGSGRLKLECRSSAITAATSFGDVRIRHAGERLAGARGRPAARARRHGGRVRRRRGILFRRRAGRLARAPRRRPGHHRAPGPRAPVRQGRRYERIICTLVSQEV